MRAGESGEDQFAGIGVTGRNRQLVAIFDGLDDLVHVGEIQLRINALRVKIQAQCHQVDIAGAFAIAEQAALDPVRARHQAEFRCSDAGTAVIMGVQADHDMVALADMFAHPLDLVGVDIGCCRLDRCRQVEDQRFFGGRLDNVHDSLDHFQAEIEFRGGKGFRRIFEMPVGVGIFFRLFAQDGRAFASDVLDSLLVELEHHVAPGRGHRVVQMDYRLFRALEAGKAGFDQVAARLGQHLDDDVVGDLSGFDQAADKIEIGGAGGRKADLDLLYADLHQEVEEALFLLRVHRIDQRLIAVAQIGGQPARGLVYRAGRPLSVGQVYLRKRAVFL